MTAGESSREFGRMHVEQFDSFLKTVNTIVANVPAVEIGGLRLVFERLEIHRPYLTNNTMRDTLDRRLLPRECRERELTYAGACFLKLRLTNRGRTMFDDFKAAGEFPIMLRSSLCHTGGELSDGEYGPWETTRGRQDPAYSEYSVAIRSVGPDELGQKNEVRLCSDGNVHVRLFIRRRAYNIPVIFLLRALSETTDSEIFNSLACDRRAIHFISRSGSEDAPLSQREALIYLGSRFRSALRVYDSLECGKELLRRILFVHLDRFEDKHVLLLEAIRRLFAVSSGEIAPDDIDLASSHEILGEQQLLAIVVREKLEEIRRHFVSRVFAAVRNSISAESSSTPASTSSNYSDSAPSLFSETGISDIFAELDDPNIVDGILRSFSSLDFSLGNKVQRFLSTGTLPTPTATSDITQLAGFTILAERINYWRFASHFQSVSRGAYFMTVKIASVRKLRPESWGFLCPLHTPDGSPCGILLHLSRGCDVRSSASPLRAELSLPSSSASKSSLISPDTLFEYGVIPHLRNSPSLYSSSAPVFFNGRLVGWSDSPLRLVSSLRRIRSFSTVSNRTEIWLEEGPGVRTAVYLSNEPGAMLRQVRNLSTGTIDWIGVREQLFTPVKLAAYFSQDTYHSGIDSCKNSRQSSSPSHASAHSSATIWVPADSSNADQYSNSAAAHHRDTLPCASQDSAGMPVYAEISNMGIFSGAAATIPFAEHNPSPRNIYQCQMAKQAMGIPAFNVKARCDNRSYVINYLQTPVVCAEGYGALADFPIGTNCVVAVLSYSAYDMEDAVVINAAARERGLFSAYVYKTARFSLGKAPHIDFVISTEAVVSPGTLLASYSNDEMPTGACRYDGTEDAVVDTIRLCTAADSTVSLTATLRIKRDMAVGDKFCSRHGQKGVMSALWREVDMPFTEQGLRPDIIINPHAFPSRMTIAMLLESMCGKVGLVKGQLIDATPFSGKSTFRRKSRAADSTPMHDVESSDGAAAKKGEENGRTPAHRFENMFADKHIDIGEELVEAGFNYFGNETMYSGVSGTPLQSQIFIGTVYYQRLRHMVSDKFQVRTSGAVVSTTRQPVGGRKNKGGMRFGEMERDALIAHGTSFLLRDRLLDCSDKTDFKWCSGCRSVLFTTPAAGCVCRGGRLLTVTLPYVFRYLCAELSAMNIRVRLDISSALERTM